VRMVAVVIGEESLVMAVVIGEDCDDLGNR
jgi:hypothetical protein